jgi:sigma-54 specific flagellar transcriptional regulator A
MEPEPMPTLYANATENTRTDNFRRLLVGESRAMQEVRMLAEYAAASQIPVLITGPSGSGKEVVAQALHSLSARGKREFVAVNCGAIPRDLLESELFGHEKGSFTGAIAQRRGRFEDANGGTLFLDEIGDMPFEMQVKLLRVLEERQVERIGGNGPIPVDCRIVSATHRNLDTAIEDGRFREDLFYRLSVYPIDIPPLAERREDIEPLIRHFLKMQGENGSLVAFSPAAMRVLTDYDWPGNARELRNIVERACVLFGQMEISAEQVSALFRRRGSTAASTIADALPSSFPRAVGNNPAAGTLIPPDGFDLRRYLMDQERRYMLSALKIAGGVVADAAELVQLRRTTFVEKMKRHRIERTTVFSEAMEG